MNLKNERQVAVTREKIRVLEARYDSLRRLPAENVHVRELTLRSLKRIINQMKEEIVRFESRESLPSANVDGYLPAVVFQSTMEEIADRFGRQSEMLEEDEEKQ